MSSILLVELVDIPLLNSIARLTNDFGVIRYVRYLDDGLLELRNSSAADIAKQQLEAITRVHPFLRFDIRFGNERIEYLDLDIYRGANYHRTAQWQTRTYEKDLALHLYTPFSSWHPWHQRRALVLGELSRHA